MSNTRNTRNEYVPLCEWCKIRALTGSMKFAMEANSNRKKKMGTAVRQRDVLLRTKVQDEQDTLSDFILPKLIALRRAMCVNAQ